MHKESRLTFRNYKQSKADESSELNVDNYNLTDSVYFLLTKVFGGWKQL